MNPDRNSEPKPVTVRVYELPADAPLRNTTIDKVLDDDKAALPYLARYEYTLAPGREESRELALSDATEFHRHRRPVSRRGERIVTVAGRRAGAKEAVARNRGRDARVRGEH